MTTRYLNRWMAVLSDPMPIGLNHLAVEPDDLGELAGLQAGEVCRLTIVQALYPVVRDDYEVIEVARVDGALTVARGVEGAERAWPAGAIVFAGLTAGMLQELAERGGDLGQATGASVVLDAGQAPTWLVSLDQDAVVTLAPAAAGARLDALILQDATGGHSVDWPAGTEWAGNAAHGLQPDQASRAELWSLGAGRWLGSMVVYAGGDEPPVEHAPRYAAAWWVNDGVTVGLFDGAGVMLGSVVLSPNYTIPQIGLALSRDAGHIVLALQNEQQAWVIETSGWTSIRVNAPVWTLGPCMSPLQIRDGYLYGVEQISGAAVFYRVALVGGVRDDLLTLPASPQSFSVGQAEATFTFNNTTTLAQPELQPATRTYDLASLELLGSQFPLPAGAELSLSPPSPYGAAGAYSPNGDRYALSVTLRYAAGAEQRAELLIYDAATHELQASYNLGADATSNYYVPVWSPDGGWIGVLLDESSDLAATLNVEAGELVLTPRPESGPEHVQVTSLMTNDGQLIFDWSTFRAVQAGAMVEPMLALPGDGYHLLLASNN